MSCEAGKCEFARWAAGALRSYYQETPQYQRLGQWLFNKLHEVRPEITGAIHGTEANCFSLNSRIPAFMAAVEEAW
jgi:hypothetical protein